MTVALLLACLLAVLMSGVLNGRRATQARHEGNRRRLRDALTTHLSITLLTILYGIFASAGTLWMLGMLLGSLAGALLGHWAIRQVTPEDLSEEQLRTDAILER